MFVTPLEGPLRVVEPGSWKPPRTGHPALREHRGAGVPGPHLEEVPDGPPEGLQVGDRPAPELRVVVEPQVSGAGQPPEVASQVGGLLLFFGRLPEELAITCFWRRHLHGLWHPAARMKSVFALAVLGRDRPGIVADVSGRLLDLACNIEDAVTSQLSGGRLYWPLRRTRHPCDRKNLTRSTGLQR